MFQSESCSNINTGKIKTSQNRLNMQREMKIFHTVLISFFNSIFSVCNVTISSKEIESRSGLTYGEIKSPSDLSGPAFCWYGFLKGLFYI